MIKSSHINIYYQKLYYKSARFIVYIYDILILWLNSNLSQDQIV